MKIKALVVVATVVMAMIASQARADIIYSVNGTASGDNYNATVDFSISNGELEMTITNNAAATSGKFDAGTGVSGITFNVGGALGSSASVLKFVEVSGTRSN